MKQVEQMKEGPGLVLDLDEAIRLLILSEYTHLSYKNKLRLDIKSMLLGEEQREAVRAWLLNAVDEEV